MRMTSPNMAFTGHGDDAEFIFWNPLAPFSEAERLSDDMERGEVYGQGQGRPKASDVYRR